MDYSMVAAATAADSAQVAGWIAPILQRWLGGLPPEMFDAILAFVVVLVLDATEWLTARGEALPVVGVIYKVWKRFGRVLNPILVMVLGWLASGNPVLGVLAAGVRSMIFKGSVITQTQRAARKLGGVAVLAACAFAFMAAPPAQANPIEKFIVRDNPLSWRARDRFHLAVGMNQRWESAQGLKLRGNAPVGFYFARQSYRMPGLLEGLYLNAELQRTTNLGSQNYWAVEGRALVVLF